MQKDAIGPDPQPRIGPVIRSIHPLLASMAQI
jgi:hypothetical protein